MRLILILLAVSLQAETTVSYWAGGHERADFAEWAMEAWAKGSGGTLRAVRVAKPEEAEIIFRFVNPRRRGLYGQSTAVQREGKIVSEIVINPSIDSLGPDMAAAVAKDPLYGDVILFLTCVHEAGHALGPVHTRDYADIMYSFEFGGDFVAYFQRYRNRLRSVDDIRATSPLSSGDIRQIKQVVPAKKQNGIR
jgi:predicted Zn-dependent protease